MFSDLVNVEAEEVGVNDDFDSRVWKLHPETFTFIQSDKGKKHYVSQGGKHCGLV